MSLIQSGDSIGAGVRLNYSGAAGDDIYILAGVTVASTTTNAIGTVSAANLSLTVDGTLISTGFAISFLGAASFVQIGSTGVLTSRMLASGSPALGFSGAGSYVLNEGRIDAARGIGILISGDSTIVNTGTVAGADPIFMGISGAGSTLINSGALLASATTDNASDSRDNHGVVSTSSNTQITNLAGGTIVATATNGAGIAFVNPVADGSIANWGLISSEHDFGVDLSLGNTTVTSSLVNHGTISGQDGAFLGGDAADFIFNTGVLNGQVILGVGSDTFRMTGGALLGDLSTQSGADFVVLRGGTIDGSIGLGTSDDRFTFSGGDVTGSVFGDLGDDLFTISRLGLGEVNGDDGIDRADFRLSNGIILALDGSFGNAAGAAGLTLISVENIVGSEAGADRIRGDLQANSFNGLGGADNLDGAGGADILRGGTGLDRLTGGLGNDVFRFMTLDEMGDTVTDFRNAAGDNDRFQIAAAVGGGLVAGTLAAANFQIRADNLAQDSTDRFIFNTTDQTLWYDEDGNGTIAAVLVADLQAGASLTFADIQII